MTEENRMTKVVIALDKANGWWRVELTKEFSQANGGGEQVFTDPSRCTSIHYALDAARGLVTMNPSRRTEPSPSHWASTQELADRATELQHEFWDAVSKLEERVGYEIDATQDFDGVPFEEDAEEKEREDQQALQAFAAIASKEGLKVTPVSAGAIEACAICVRCSTGEDPSGCGDCPACVGKSDEEADEDDDVSEAAYQCPHCQSEEGFTLVVLRRIEIDADGDVVIDEDGNSEWDDDTQFTCKSCDYTGASEEFYIG